MAEIGIALAIAPLIISAAEKYSTAARYMKRYQRSETGIQELVEVVNIQRRIFYKKIWRMLAYDVGLEEDTATEMMHDADHLAWVDVQTEAYFTQRMGDCMDDIQNSIRRIDAQLSLLNSEKYFTLSQTPYCDAVLGIGSQVLSFLEAPRYTTDIYI